MGQAFNILNSQEKEILEGFKLAYILSNFIGRLDHIHVEIQKRSLAYPNAIAVCFKEYQITYKELDDKSNQLANHLITLGLRSQDTVGICLEESHLIPISILAVLKAGGTYVPLLRDFPQKRIDGIAKDAQFKCIITNDDLTELKFKNTNYKEIRLDQDLDVLKPFAQELSAINIENNDAAYIMFTSGSTGDPKGVIVEHRSLSSYLEWYLNDLYEVTKINLPLTSSICFAASITQLFSPLLLGKTLHVLERNTIKVPEKLLDFYQEHTGFGLYCVPTLWEEIINYVEQHASKNIKSPEIVYLSGEALSEKLVNRTFKLWPHIDIWNLYGPTEATANISYAKVLKGNKIHLGKAIRGGKILILDEEFNQVPQGEEGYIYITSRALARGYLNQPKLSTSTFIEDHKLEVYKEFKLYNTGDRGKINDNNELIYLGRNDQQVKVRGFRIELTGIELILKEHPSIRQAICKINHENDKHIVAFIVAKNTLHADEIRHYLEDKLPEYMIPEHYYMLDEMPKLPNGKINKHKLIPTANRPLLSYDLITASNDLESDMIAIWKEVLGISTIGMNDDFFDLGGNSLKSIKLINKVNSTFKTGLEINVIWNNPTPKEVVALVQSQFGNEISRAEPQKTTVSTNAFSLTFIQSSLWFIHQSRQDQSAYNLLFHIDFLKAIDIARLKKAIETVVQKQDVLRSNFKVENKNPIRFLTKKEIDFTIIDHLNSSKEQLKQAFTEFEKAAFEKRYVLESDALIKFTLLKLPEHKFKLYLEAHHIIFDGISIAVFIKDLNDVYLEKSPVKLAATYSDFQKEWNHDYYSNKLNRTYEFWKKKLDGANYVLDLPLDYNRPKIQTYKGNTNILSVNAVQKLKIETFNKENKLSSFITLISVFYVLLYKYSKEKDILLGVPFANRTQAEHDHIVGAFVNTLVFRVQLSDEMTFAELLNKVKTYTVEAIANQQFPFDKLVEKLNPERNASMNPVFQVMFAYHSAIDVPNETEELMLNLKEVQNPNCKFDLDLEVQEETDRILFNFNYNEALFSSESIETFTNHYQNILTQSISNKEVKLKEISLFGEEEQAESYILKGPQIEVDPKRLHKYLELQAQETPNKIALVHETGTLSFAELNGRANQLANFLIAKGVKNNDRVGVLMNRSVEMIVSIYGILKSGAAYLPLDPTHPVDRITTIVEDANPKIILTSQVEFKLSDVEVVDYKHQELWSNTSKDNPKVEGQPSDLAYVIYTSGTTNIPKGVMVQHHAICNRILWMQNAYPINTMDVIIQKTAYTFDVSLWELFWWSMTGSSLDLLEVEGEKNPEAILRCIEYNKVSVIHFVPSMFATFLDYISEKNLGSQLNLKYIFTSGEALERYHIEKFEFLKINNGQCQLINLYGPTEAAVDVTHFDTNNEHYKLKVPIGMPIQNTEICILSEAGKIVPFNVPGELAIGGLGLAKGYINQPELTTEKFVYNKEIKKKLYKTGDSARILADGHIEFIGRLDDQVKIRGYRIELGEIKDQLLKHPNVKDAIVLLKTLSSEDKRLVVYYRLKTKEDIDFSRFLKKSLPGYMIPSYFIEIDTIPLKTSGKLDEKKLPDPFKSDKRSIGEKEFHTDFEKRLAKIWVQILQTDAFYAQDNFYDVGGHSLLLIAMKCHIDKEFDIDISIVELFQYPTIKMLAEVIASNKKENQKQKIASRAAMQRRAMSNYKKH